MELKQSISERSNNGEFIYLFIFNKLGVPLKKKNSFQYENTFNPFYDDSKPSFSIFFDKKIQRWCHHDYGTNNEGIEFKGDFFNIAMPYYNLCEGRFMELLYRMDCDITMNMEFGNKMLQLPTKSFYNTTTEEDDKKLKFDLLKMNPSDKCKIHFNQFGINLDDFDNVHQLNGYRLLNEDGSFHSSKKFKQSEKNIHIAYDFGNFCKIYRLEPKKFWYLGNKTEEYVFGSFDEANYPNEPLFLVGGEKDVMTAQSLGYKAFCLGSETIMPSQRIIKDAYECRYKIVVLYDIDETGFAMSKKINEKWGFQIANLSTIIPTDCYLRIKDISDYIKYNIGREKLIDFLESFKSDENEVETITNNDIKNESFEIEIDFITNETSNIVNCNNSDIKETKDITANTNTIEIDDKEELLFEKEKSNKYEGINETIYNRLPPLLKEICNPIKASHEKDLVFLSSLGLLSNTFKVYGIYDSRTIYPNLFIFITAKPSAGKGVLRWVETLGAKIHKRKLLDYKNELTIYNKLEPDEKREEEKPLKQTFFIPGNASSSSMIKQLSNNGGFGVIIESEADALNAVLDKEWGNYSDILRKSFEFETIRMLRQNDENSFEIEKPRLSVILTGTQRQLMKLIPTTENGLFSRFIFLEFPLIKTWKNVFERTINFDEHYQSIGEQLEKYYYSPKNNDFEVILTHNQQLLISEKFKKYQRNYDGLLGEDIIASIRRIANMHFRICMLLTAIRLIDHNPTDSVECSDADFDIATELVIVLLENVRKIYDYMPKENIALKKLHLKQTLLYESLENNFSFDDVRENAEKLIIPLGTAENYLRIYQKQQLAERISKGLYCKIKL